MSAITRTFSDTWYRVADFRPKLSPHLMVRRQTYRDETWFVLGDPASSKFYRFNAAAYRFLGLLDGQRTVHEAWEICNAQLGDDAPTQNDCINLLAQLQLFGLLKNDLPIDPDRLRERIDKVRERRHAERVGGYVFFTIPLINPERFLRKYANLARLAFSGWGLAALLILIATALSMILPRWDELHHAANNIIAPHNLVWLSLSLLFLKVIHEFAHGFACKAYGGRVTEIGVFMMLIMPLPFCDATASWAFSSKWRRILVSAAGMMVEMAVASVAAIVWAVTDPGLVHTLAYNVMFIASVVTVLFNLNPLLRYDGYYILSDLLEIPNLAPRSHELLKYLTRRHLFGLKGETPPPLESRREGAWMITHALCAFPYRLLVLAGIVLFVAQQYFILGVLIGAFGAIMWLFVPVTKGISYVVSDPMLQVVRPRAVGVTFGLIAMVIGFITLVPMPNRIRASGVIMPEARRTFRAPNEGYLAELAVANGDRVRAGDLLLRLENPRLETDYRKSLARIEIERIRLSAATAGQPVERRLAEPLYRDAVARHRVVSKLFEEMTMHAPFDGRVVAPELDTRVGSFIQKGAALLTLASFDELLVNAYVSDRDFAQLVGREEVERRRSQLPADRDPIDAGSIRAKKMEVKIHGMTDRTFAVRVDRQVPVATRSIRHPSLGHTVEGGRIVMDPEARDEARTINPQWEITFRFADPQRVRAHSKALSDEAAPSDESNSQPNGDAQANAKTAMNGNTNPDSNERTEAESKAAAGSELEADAEMESDAPSETAPFEVLALPGTRATVRLTLAPEPLAVQWWRSIRRAFARRFDL